ncbi:diguanylate cyclase [Vogesella fluminis]|uniref:diguanylate cyclase n=1 Tax=Vogesella fluminis TaxID=1069161 RepID=A0ABQ3H676_9NEIS|nr:sensor domain-containing diguanylate cyclase [Vogesella fluminis]GHD71576.1 hypothetical protein GCM10011419_03490 [Vogesella fluminis]
MKREASIAIPDGDLQRLEAYGVAIRQIRSGQFLARQCLSVSGSTVDPANPVDVLGYELAQLAQWLELRFGEFRKILEVSEEISSELFAEKVLDRIYQTFSSLIPYDRIGCALLSENGQRLSAYWARASYENLKINKHYTADMAGSSLETTLVSGKPRIINDLEEYLFYHPDSVSTQLILAEGIHSNLTCPLIANGKPLGFLFFSSCQTNTYRDLHHDIFLQIAGQVSVLIERSLLYQQLFEVNRQLMEAHQQLKEQSMHDALTGVLNRGAIFELLNSHLCEAGRKKRLVAIIMADLDHFKDINDNHGHLAGDAVLHTVATTIEKTLRGYDHVGRYGGEEFLIILSEADVQTACEVAERVRQTVAALAVPCDGDVIRLSLRQGVALSYDDERADRLIARADAALYLAKQEGRNCYRLAPSGIAK